VDIDIDIGMDIRVDLDAKSSRFEVKATNVTDGAVTIEGMIVEVPAAVGVTRGIAMIGESNTTTKNLSSRKRTIGLAGRPPDKTGIVDKKP